MALNRKYLLGMGVSEKEADRFFANGAFSPTAQTAFVLNLRSLEGVANRNAFVKLAAETSSTEADAIFLATQTAALMSKLHKGDVPLARITAIGGFPVCTAKESIEPGEGSLADLISDTPTESSWPRTIPGLSTTSESTFSSDAKRPAN